MTSIGIVGYGKGGRVFHAPYIKAAGLDIGGVVTRNPARAEQVQQELPGVPVFASLGELLASGVDAVTITTPPVTHADLALEAIAAGVPLVVDKPFVRDLAQADEVREASRAADVPLSIYHNRRWDPDVRTVKALLDAGALGPVRRLTSVSDLDEAEGLEVGEGNGLLRDIGSHLVDQVLFLLGPAVSVDAHLDWTEVDGQRVDCGFEVHLLHGSGAASTVASSKLNHLDAREWRVYGTEGSYVASGVDEHVAGTLFTQAGEQAVPQMDSDYTEYYRAFGAAVRGEGEVPVPVDEAVDVLRVLDAAARSDAEERRVQLTR